MPKDKNLLKKEISEYIDKYYIPVRDDITMDNEMKEKKVMNLLAE